MHIWLSLLSALLMWLLMGLAHTFISLHTNLYSDVYVIQCISKIYGQIESSPLIMKLKRSLFIITELQYSHS
jgi:hypothetical protein